MGLRMKSKPTKSKVKKQLDLLASEICKQRDGHHCVVEGCKNESAQAHHIFSRKNLSVRWRIESPSNLITLCFHHHKNIAHGEPEQFRRWLLESWFTPKEYEKLYQLSRIVTHWKIDELLRIREQLKGMLDE